MAILGADGTLQISSARLHAQVLPIPPGVLESARATGENRITWQPEPGVREAVVAVPWNGGVVVAGRSLAESEARTDRLYLLIGAGWLAGLVGAACLLAEGLRRQPPPFGRA